jgi:predicted nucleotidyltransferase
MIAATKPLPTLAQVRDVVARTCANLPITKVELFGSLASGQTHADSDVDLLLEFASDAKFGLFELGGLKNELEEQLGRRVDLLSRDAVEHSTNPYRRRSILAAPLTVYDKH